MLIAFQILFVLFALLAIGAVLKRRHEKVLGVRGLVFWVLFWVAAIVIVVWPETASMLAEAFGIGRGADFVLYSAIALLFLIIFRLHIKLESLNRDLTVLTRQDALKDKK